MSISKTALRLAALAVIMSVLENRLSTGTASSVLVTSVVEYTSDVNKDTVEDNDDTDATKVITNGKVSPTGPPIIQSDVLLKDITVTTYFGNVTQTVTDAELNKNNRAKGTDSVGNGKIKSKRGVQDSQEDCQPYYCCEPFLSDRDHHTLMKKEVTLLNIITYFWISIFLCLGGLIGNILSFIVLHKQKANTSVFFLKCLAVSDGLYMLWYLVFDLYYTAYTDSSWVTNREDPSVHVLPANNIYINFGNVTLTLYSSWLVVFLTIDRFIIVRVPLKANSLCTLNKARVEAFVLFVCCVGFNMPLLWQYTSSIELHPCWDYLIMYKDPTKFGSSYGTLFVYSVVLTGLIRNLIPVFMVLIMNVLLVVGLMEASARRRKLVSNDKDAQKRDGNISLMLITVATLYLILLLPSLGLTFLRGLWFAKKYLRVDLNIDEKHFNSIGYYAPIGHLLIRVNSAINFIVYILVSKKFRDGLKELVCCKKSGPGEPYKITSTKTLSSKSSSAKSATRIAVINKE